MTRETKVGLVVASSFLCLVGVVVASRLGRNSDVAGGESSTVVENITPTHDHNPSEKGDPKKPDSDKNKSPIVLAQGETKGHNANPPPPVNPNANNPNSLPPIPQFNFDVVNSGTPPPIPPVPEHNEKKGVSNPPDHQNSADANHANIMKQLEEEKKKSEKVAIPANTNPGTQSDTFPPPPFNVAQTNKDAPQPVVANPFPEPNKQEFVFPPPANPPTLSNQEQPGAGKPPAQPLPQPPPPGIAFPTQQPPGDQKPTSPNAFPPMGNSKPQPGQFEVPKEPTKPNLPPMGSKELSNDMKKLEPFPSVPSKVPAAANLPSVKDVALVPYPCQIDDTSFEAVSTRFYKTPKYARALQEFNKEHPLSKENVKQVNPRLALDQVVFVPPVGTLETRFASFINNAPNPLTTQQQAPISINSPVNSAGGGLVPGLPTIARQPNAVPSPDPTRTYRVAGQGQLLAEIAQQQLGDHRRWTEIYRLNGNLHPEVPIPGGTEIRLPVATP